jgi:hypothetical protein
VEVAAWVVGYGRDMRRHAVSGRILAEPGLVDFLGQVREGDVLGSGPARTRRRWWEGGLSHRDSLKRLRGMVRPEGIVEEGGIVEPDPAAAAEKAAD